jgi:hypothetical protein
MVATLQQKLVAAISQGLGNFFPVGRHVRYVSLGMARYAIEIAKLAIGNAHIGSVYISVNLPRYFTLGNLFFSHFVRYKHQFSQRCMLKKKNTFFYRKKTKLLRLLIEISQVHNYSLVWQFTNVQQEFILVFPREREVRFQLLIFG